jgi:DNA-binding MarR family transcriptional regulator
MENIRRCFHVIEKAASRYIVRNIEDDLNVTEIEMLRLLTFCGPMSQKSVSESLYIDKSVVARIVTRLENAGYIHREHSSEDGRVNLVWASEKGKRVRACAVENEDHFYNWLMNCVEPGKKEIFVSVLQELLSRASQALDGNFETVPAITEKTEGYNE